MHAMLDNVLLLDDGARVCVCESSHFFFLVPTRQGDMYALDTLYYKSLISVRLDSHVTRTCRVYCV